MTSGCTRQAAGPDKLAARQSLPFALLADADERLCKRLDVIKQKSLYGRKYLGLERSALLVHGAGPQQEWRNVKVPAHAEEVLEAARRL
jgi:peroxiredoxin Q/BCP